VRQRVPHGRRGLAPGLDARHSVLAFPPEVRRAIHTTNALENVNRQLRKIIKTRGHFPNDEAATTLLWLALRNIASTWQWCASTWPTAMNQFAILYQDRFTRALV
jgi:putative transposase